ncbi:FAD-binding domain-containing protein [Teratosphaeria destructans]|uniref:FAD-binding domain-containing protein n=1 Tax=Teratosphaeria destructans TaxID=418781 RepID=A0A9W7W6H3_9PEZI|nr:FAD-binding domain-containing protein [Teratosphaeria destructans]
MSTLAQSTQAHALIQALAEAEVQFQVLVPEDPDYDARVQSYWSLQTRLKPSHFILPRSAQEVASVIKVLTTHRATFAVRSGGHTPHAGANNIEGGVTIDLSLMNWTRYDAAAETVDIGPGGRWRDVYGELDKHGRVVAGGRNGTVGVGGLIIGGGISFSTGRRGFACDDVISFEVVLADGRIITASMEEHPDLYFALKGGSGNFGIVTNYKMHALKSEGIYGGLKVYPEQVTPSAIEALPDFKDIVVVVAFAQVAGVADAPAYDGFKDLPAIMNTCKPTTALGAVSEYDVVPGGNQSTFFTATFGNEARIVAKATELHKQFVDDLKGFIPDGDFTTQCLLQPLPKIYGEISARHGGNVMGLDRQPIDGLLFVAIVLVKTPEQQAFAYPRIQSWVEKLRAYAATIEDGNLDWVYLNYADRSQDPLRSYGAENVRRMKQVAAKYDPQAVFQDLCPGGFKISHVAELT